MLRMHEGQWDLDAAAAGRVVADRYPGWAGLPLQPVASSGTVNVLFRLGDAIVLRFPLDPDPDPARVERLRAAQTVASRVPTSVALPELLDIAAPHERYPGWSTAWRWIEGDQVSPHGVPAGLAEDLAEFVLAVRAVPLTGPRLLHSWRSGPLSAVDPDVRAALDASRALVDVPPLERLWEDARGAAAPAAPTWIHTDLMPGNLLTTGGRLSAVLDCEDFAVGDPSVDLMPAWNLLAAAPRARFREAIGVDEDAWRRGRGWALAQAALALPYYADTNPVMAATARRTLGALLED